MRGEAEMRRRETETETKRETEKETGREIGREKRRESPINHRSSSPSTTR